MHFIKVIVRCIEQLLLKFNKKSHYSTVNINHLSDTEGLNKAYTNGKDFFVDGNTLYVAGTFGKNTIKSNINDIASDITIAFGLSLYSERYRDSSDILDEYYNISEVISHSLGASASAKYVQNNFIRNIRLTTYGAPLVSMSNKRNDNYTSLRNLGDVVSVLDRGSITTNRGGFNPLTNHQHSLYADTGKDVTRSIEPVKEIL